MNLRLRISRLLVIWMAAIVPAGAHAILLEATPSANAILRDGHLHVVLHFNSRVDGKRSQLTLISMQGESKIQLKPQAEPDRLTAADVDLKPGPYRLIWQVLAADGHLTRGQIPFKVQ